MKLEDLVFSREDIGIRGFESAKVSGIKILRAYLPCVGRISGRRYEPGQYGIVAPDGRDWYCIDALTAQCVLYELLGGDDET
jgi:hypothetical protein